MKNNKYNKLIIDDRPLILCLLAMINGASPEEMRGPALKG